MPEWSIFLLMYAVAGFIVFVCTELGYKAWTYPTCWVDTWLMTIAGVLMWPLLFARSVFSCCCGI